MRHRTQVLATAMLLGFLPAAILPHCEAAEPDAAGSEKQLNQPLVLEFLFDGRPAPRASADCCGFRIVAGNGSPQIAVTSHPATLLLALSAGQDVTVRWTTEGPGDASAIAAWAELRDGVAADIVPGTDRGNEGHTLRHGRPFCVLLPGEVEEGKRTVRTWTLRARAADGPAVFELRDFEYRREIHRQPLHWELADTADGLIPPPVLPPLHPAIEDALIRWDWRMQDGIVSPRAAVSFSESIGRLLAGGDHLLADLKSQGVATDELAAEWVSLHSRYRRLLDKQTRQGPTDEDWESLWLRVHRLRRSIALNNPLADFGPLVFVKQVPGRFSHQLTQYYGRYARPGGGVFVLDEPGRSMRARRLAGGQLPEGSYQHPEISYDAQRILFSYCEAEPKPRESGQPGPFYHLYEMTADGSEIRRLTDGPYDDFAPRYLPDGRLVFISTRRGGWHRCGNPGCENYTLAMAEADGSNPHPVSYHETQEWDPAVLADGRIVYTRWDYVDRHAVFYEQLWTVRTDGTAPTAFYGNNTFNPVGIWEPKAVPGSEKVMATAAAHHAMTAGSIILVDVSRGVDGLGPIDRLTPDVLFPESEAKVAPRWYAPVGVKQPPEVPEPSRRWPGHCYRSPHPLSEKYFLAAYSFASLVGEPEANQPNMFGIYLVDAFGNKELLYRDLNIASLWPVPLAPRDVPPTVCSARDRSLGNEGTFFIQNIHASQPSLPQERIERLRIVQVLPKSTPGINRPKVGLANASPGKQVLGTVPVEADGSVFFRAPAKVPLAFQALDAQGRAVQIMRSVTYLQPGERGSCVGCHEHRMTAPTDGRFGLALTREPSTIEPGPEGSRPLSYPILVQPVLDRYCVACHNHEKADGDVVLTGEPEGHFTVSYNALAPRVPAAYWRGGAFREANSEPLSRPEFFGARGSRLMDMLLEGHEGVELDAEALERLTTWMDANALFYGTFEPADQARQLRGERIEGPGIE